MSIIAWIVLGAIAGYLAGFLVKGDEGLGVIGHIVLGIVGALVGGFLAGVLLNSNPIDGPFDISSIVAATIGAVIVVLVASAVMGRTRTGSERSDPPDGVLGRRRRKLQYTCNAATYGRPAMGRPFPVSCARCGRDPVSHTVRAVAPVDTIDGRDAVREGRLLERLVAVGQALSARLDRPAIAEIVLREAVEAFEAPLAGFFVVEGDLLRVLGAHGARQDLIDFLDGLPIDRPGWVAGDAVRRGVSLFFATEEELEAAYPRIAELPVRSGYRGGLAYVPLLAEGSVLGLIGLRFDGPRHLSEAERGFLHGFAHQAALALERAAAFEAEQEARDRASKAATRTARLLAVTEALAGAIDRDEVARVIVEAASGALDADAGALAIVDEGDAELEIVSVGGFDEPSRAVGRRSRWPASDPLSTVLRAGTERSYRTATELRRDFPESSDPVPGGFEAVVRSCCSGTRIACWVASS